ncbi:MAG: ATP-binding protein, partial [Thiohalobacteraceae bacterium]
LVDDLLDVSRITMGKLTLQKERVELHPILRDAVDTVRTMMSSLDHELIQDIPDEPIYLDGDATRLAQIFSNLLNNAAKYTDAGQPIRLCVAREDSDVVIRVVDSGIGLAADTIPEIFEAFAQVDRSLERSHSGLGVGLALAKRLVELHGGSIEAHSPGVGQGSEFIVRLPVQAVDAAATETRTPGDAGSAGAARYRILLADDNVDFATSMAMLLQAVGHEVRVAHDGAEAVTIAEVFRPQFAFLDIGLPLMNGYDLARCLRNLPATADTRLIAVTGWGQERDRQLAREAGFEYHLVKPVAFPQIEEILKGTSMPKSGRSPG